MFDDTYIGVDDKNGKPIHNGNIVQTDVRGGIRKFRVIYDQEECAFKLQQLNVPFNHTEHILSYIQSRYYEVIQGG